MANETEVERLVVRLMGDVSQYMKAMDDTVQRTNAALGEIEKATKKIEGFTQEVTGFAKGAANALGAIGIKTGLMDSFRVFETAEVNTKKLTAAIQVNGGDVQKLTADYKAFAKEMAEVSVNAPSVTMGLLKQAEVMGITGDAAQKVVRNAMAIAVLHPGGTAGDAAGHMREAMQLEEGNVDRLTRLIPTLHAISDPALKAAEAQKVLAAAFEQVRIDGMTADAQLQRATNQMAPLTKEIGSLVANGVRKAAEALGAMAKWFNSLDPTVRTWIATIAAATGAILFFVTALTAAKTALLALGLSWKTVSLATWIGVLAAAGYAGYKLGEYLSGTTKHVEALKQSLKEAQALTELTTKVQKDETTRITQQIEMAVPEDKKALIEKHRKETEDAINSKKNDIANANKVMEGMGYFQDKSDQEQLIKDADKMLSNLRERAGILDKMKADAEHKTMEFKGVKEAEENIKNLKEELALFAMEGREREAYKARLHGSTVEQLDANLALARQLDEMDEFVKKMKEADALQQKRADEGASLMAKWMTPEEKYEQRLEELNTLFYRDTISLDVFNKEVEAAQQAMYEATGQANDFRQALDGIKGSAVGSADAVGKIRAYQQFLMSKGGGEVMPHAMAAAQAEARGEGVVVGPRLPDGDKVLEGLKKVPAQLLKDLGGNGNDQDAQIQRAQALGAGLGIANAGKQIGEELLRQIAASLKLMEAKPPVEVVPANLRDQ